jgi:hypothetical protein
MDQIHNGLILKFRLLELCSLAIGSNFVFRYSNLMFKVINLAPPLRLLFESFEFFLFVDCFGFRALVFEFLVGGEQEY